MSLSIDTNWRSSAKGTVKAIVFLMCCAVMSALVAIVFCAFPMEAGPCRFTRCTGLPDELLLDLANPDYVNWLAFVMCLGCAALLLRRALSRTPPREVTATALQWLDAAFILSIADLVPWGWSWSPLRLLASGDYITFHSVQELSWRTFVPLYAASLAVQISLALRTRNWTAVLLVAVDYMFPRLAGWLNTTPAAAITARLLPWLEVAFSVAVYLYLRWSLKRRSRLNEHENNDQEQLRGIPAEGKAPVWSHITYALGGLLGLVGLLSFALCLLIRVTSGGDDLNIVSATLLFFGQPASALGFLGAIVFLGANVLAGITRKGTPHMLSGCCVGLFAAVYMTTVHVPFHWSN